MQERLLQLRSQVSEAVFYVDHALRELRPVARYMAAFRNCGLLSFVLALVIGTGAISKGLAVVFATLCLVALVYSGLDETTDASWQSMRSFNGGIACSIVAIDILRLDVANAWHSTFSAGA